jgi:hypothetical protein
MAYVLLSPSSGYRHVLIGFRPQNCRSRNAAARIFVTAAAVPGIDRASHEAVGNLVSYL